MGRDVQHVFLIGAKGFGGYGGYETFVNKLTEYHQNNKKIQYHVACKANGDGCMNERKLKGVELLSSSEFQYHNAHCFKIHVPEIGPAQAIYYDIAALKYCRRYIKDNKIDHPIIYIMACRIGPFMHRYYKKFHKLGGLIYLNPDGHEWARSKWSVPVRLYWKVSERLMVRNSDLIVCDSRAIERYIHTKYDGKGHNGNNPQTTFIAYGAEARKSKLSDNDPQLEAWYKKERLSSGNYYLFVGRYAPENNYETIIREFMRSSAKRNLALITNAKNELLNKLDKKIHFREDKRIKFVGTVYDEELLMKIRENAYGYFHGHEVGGTNPSLLEALGSTDLNLLLDVEFNREVAGDSALYWDKGEGNLAELINTADEMSEAARRNLGEQAKKRVRDSYSWNFISDEYLAIFQP